MPKKSYLPLLIGVLLLKSLVALVIIATSGIELSPDEAQYWTWSRALDFGYYSKPPGIAWEIFLTTHLVGHTLIGVRLGGVIMAFLMGIALFRLGKKSGVSERVAFWAALIFSLSPIGFYLTFATTTDGGAVLGLLLAIGTIAETLTTKKRPKYFQVGLWIGLGALFKWVAFILWPFIFLFLLFYPSLRSWKILGGVALSLCALLPSLYWNWTHDFATFKHVASTVVPRMKEGNAVDFFFAQVALYSPIFFLLLIAGYKKLFKAPPGVVFCALLPGLALIYLGASFQQKIQANWALYLYPASMLFIAWFALDHLKKGLLWLGLGMGISILMLVSLLMIPYVQRHNLLPQIQLPYAVNPFRQNLGWERIPPLLETAGYNADTDFLVSDKYQTVSILSFYNREKKPAYFLNLQGRRKNHFSYRPSLQQEQGKTGYFLIAENAMAQDLSWYQEYYLQQLEPYFSKLNYKGAYPLFEAYGKGVKYLFVFEGINYTGLIPKEKEKY